MLYFDDIFAISSRSVSPIPSIPRMCDLVHSRFLGKLRTTLATSDRNEDILIILASFCSCFG
jgi:hypothetical protein